MSTPAGLDARVASVPVPAPTRPSIGGLFRRAPAKEADSTYTTKNTFG